MERSQIDWAETDELSKVYCDAIVNIFSDYAIYTASKSKKCDSVPIV